MKSKEMLTVLHISDYSAHYQGNFVDSLEALEPEAGGSDVQQSPVTF